MSEEPRVQSPEVISGDDLPVTPPRRALLQPLIAALLLAIICLPVPFVSPENDADTSLVMLLDFARRQNLQFGVDFVNTYGPLGFLIFPYYSGEVAGLRLIADLLISFAAAAGVCLLAWRQSRLWRWLLLGVFLWISSNIRMGPELWLNIMLLSWGGLCFIEEGRWLAWCGLVTAVLAGFCAVAKISFLVLGSGGIALLALSVWLRGRRRLSVGMLALFVGAFFAGWCSTGQEIGNVPAFLQTALASIRGYNAALGFEARPSLRSVGMATALMAAAAVALRCVSAFGSKTRMDFWRGLPLLVWALSLTFTSWKHGFVRGDSYHVTLFFGFIPILLLSLEALPVTRGRWIAWVRGVGLACSCVSVAALQFFCLQTVQSSLLAPWDSVRLNVRRLVSPAEFRREADSRLELHRAQAQLPKLRDIIGTASVDVFGFGQSFALFNGLNFRPRPVSQSYAACNADLMRINQSHVLSAAGPEYFLFELHSLDSKFAALEDAMVLRDLFLNFESVGMEDRFVLLKRASSAKPRLRLLREANVKPGEPIDLRTYGNTNLWIEIHLAPSLWGRLRQFVAQPPVLRLAAWKSPGQNLIYRHQARASLLAAGFMASPLLRWTREIIDHSTAAPRPGAYTVELSGQDLFWESSGTVRIFEIEEGSVAPASHSQAAASTALSRPFRVFPDQRWRPDLPPIGGVGEAVAFALILLLPFATVAVLLLLARRVRKSGRAASLRTVVLGNVLLFAAFLFLAWAAAETWFRYFYDTTDSLAYTRVCERWVQRHWKVNNAGCRDDIDYSPVIGPRKKRITFVGDSFTAGHGIKEVKDRFPNLIREQHPDSEVHVLANIGLDTGAETVLINKMTGKGYEFDRVVLVYCLNDIGDLVAQQDAAFTRAFDAMTSGGWLTQNSYALNLFTLRYKAARNPYIRDYFSFVREAYQGETWERQKARLREFRMAVESRGGKLSVVTFPFLHALGSEYPYRKVHEQLDTFWREERIPHLDLLSAYVGHSPQELVVNAHDAHPNELAHRLAAEALERFLFLHEGANQPTSP